MQRFRGCVQRIDCRVTGSLRCVSCFLSSQPRCLPGFAEPLTLFANGLERVAMLVPHLPRFFREQSELFRLIPARLGGHAVFLGDSALVLGVPAAALSLFTHALGLLALPLWRDLIVRHVNLLPAGRASAVPASASEATKSC